MRVDLARQILTKDFIVFDEFTSVVDRQVAQVICIALKKALKRYPEKKFIAVGCHHAMGTAHKRLHHNVDWERCVPKILSEELKQT